MISQTKKLISKYGQKMAIKENENSDSISIRAFIQPLRSDYQSSLYGDYSEGDGTEQFLYIGPPDYKLSEYSDTARIIFDNESYKIKKSESVYFREKVIYERAVLEKDV